VGPGAEGARLCVCARACDRFGCDCPRHDRREDQRKLVTRWHGVRDSVHMTGAHDGGEGGLDERKSVRPSCTCKGPQVCWSTGGGSVSLEHTPTGSDMNVPVAERGGRRWRRARVGRCVSACPGVYACAEGQSESKTEDRPGSEGKGQ
jgi:hypothetical protein